MRDIGTKELMKQVSFVFQDSHLFKDSLLNNIRAAKPEADKEEVMKALKAARCEDIIEKMPQGLDTVVGTKGVYLSGGEMQRFCIARALGQRTQFLLADEISTMLDLITQSQIWHFLMDETEKRRIGMIVVSHSPELLEKVCTRVVDLQKE